MIIRPAERRFATVVLAAIALALSASPGLHAAAILGKVTEVAGQTATISVEGTVAPAIGDSVEIFFKLGGAEDEISVATGKVVSVERGTVKVKIEQATGDVAKDQLARIASVKSSAATESPSSPATSNPKSTAPSASEETIRASLTGGKWAAKSPLGLQATVVFKSDGTVVVPLQQRPGAFVTGKYSIDAASSPPRVLITGIEIVPAPQFTEAELKEFQEDLERIKQFQPLPPDKGRARHLNQPVKDALLASTWIGEIGDPMHIRIQGFTEAEAAGHPKLGAEAATLTKIGLHADGPIADLNTSTTSTSEASPTPKRYLDEPEPPPPPEVPPEKELNALTRDSLLAFNKAVKAKNFTSFHQTVSNLWQRQVTPAQLQEAFQSFINQRVDISSVLRADPIFDEPAMIDSDQRLILEGHCPAKKPNVKFRLKFVNENGAWKLIGIWVTAR
jgi:hypothetical protein